MGRRIDIIKEKLRSQRGRNFIVFLTFVGLSALLWMVQALNEFTQRDMRCPVVITHVPDTLTRITPLPEAINVNVRAKGTDMLKYSFRDDPTLTFDFRSYKQGNRMFLGDAAFKAYLRNKFGKDVEVQSVSPDSLIVEFTSSPPIKVPVRADVKAIPAVQMVQVGRPHSLTDSVEVYSLNGIPTSMRYVSTEPLTINEVKKSQIVRLALSMPRGMRAIPDSVDVAIEVEPMISRKVKTPVRVINAPAGTKIILMPSQIDVYYGVPMSTYQKANSDPKFDVVADYSKVKPGGELIPVEIVKIPKNFNHVYKSTDSLDFYIER
ncbi:MAG: hypothetical protein K2N16_07525 [Muribaculaceae bacterium]|nr:hypothetical protein [Muribaculaceae bacterium]